jgi:hypothetical protein
MRATAQSTHRMSAARIEKKIFVMVFFLTRKIEGDYQLHLTPASTENFDTSDQALPAPFPVDNAMASILLKSSK